MDIGRAGITGLQLLFLSGSSSALFTECLHIGGGQLAAMGLEEAKTHHTQKSRGCDHALLMWRLQIVSYEASIAF